jgi:ABC-type bacteriocin/lantibiotic exporter with double-glycine peptidase domain
VGRVTDPLSIEPVMQKDVADCGVACLAMLLGESYAAVRATIRQRELDGLSNRQLRRIAHRFGKPLRFIRNGDLSEMVGIVDLQRPTNPERRAGAWEGHYVVLIKGALYNPADGLIWTDIEAWLAHRRWELLGVFIRKEDA